MIRAKPFLVARRPPTPDDVRVGALAHVGAVPCANGLLYVTAEQLQLCARPTADGVFDLEKDIKDQAVYRDPEQLRQRVQTLNDLEAKYSGTFTPDAEYIKNKKLLQAELDLLDARAKAIGPARTKKDIAFSEAFYSFKDQWDQFYNDKIVANTNVTGNQSRGQQLDEYDNEYRDFVVQFKSLGYVVTHVPPKPADPNALPWDAILTIVKYASIGVVAIVAISLWRSA